MTGTVIINPGSGGLTEGTERRATELAYEWLENMEANGIHDVEILDSPEYDGEGRWSFTFRHKVTGIEKILTTHGLTNKQHNEYLFAPRVYWDGSSCSEPELSDFLADGYRIAIIQDNTNEEA